MAGHDKLLHRILLGAADANLQFKELQVRRQQRMMKYEVIIYWSQEDGAFLAEVPELPGCMADGATYEEALENVQTIVQEWIETARESGRTVPEPKGRLTFA